jgi:hypothetical protein
MVSHCMAFPQKIIPYIMEEGYIKSELRVKVKNHHFTLVITEQCWDNFIFLGQIHRPYILLVILLSAIN